MADSVNRQLTNFFKDRLGKYAYTQDYRRTEPDKFFATDCSGLIWYGYKHLLGIEIGTWTGAQQNYGKIVFNTSCNDIATAKKLLKESDCIFYDWNGTSRGMYDHVDYYVGGDVTYGHGGPGKGPTIQSFQSQWNAAHYIIARRYLPDIPVIPSEPSKTTFKTIPMSNFPLMRTEYFGDINGPENSRGGYYLWERKYVKMIQEWLVEHEYAGNVDPANWCDGLFEQPTIDAVAAMQRAELPGTTLFGQVWWDDWAHMMANNGQG